MVDVVSLEDTSDEFWLWVVDDILRNNGCCRSIALFNKMKITNSYLFRLGLDFNFEEIRFKAMCIRIELNNIMIWKFNFSFRSNTYRMSMIIDTKSSFLLSFHFDTKIYISITRLKYVYCCK